MKKLFFLIFATLISGLIAQNVKQDTTLSVIPKPLKMERLPGFFQLNSETIIVFNDSVAYPDAELMAEQLRKVTGFGLPVELKNNRHSHNCLNLDLSTNDTLGNEGYTLKVSKQRIIITAHKPAGLFYGYQTLKQLMPVSVYSKEKVSGINWKIPAVQIFDKPAFTWRGMHLDVSRHFFSKEFVKRYIDMIAMHKMNKFHWHLTDANGWRIEIKKYPKLTSICAWRVPRVGWRDTEPAKPGEKPTYGGYYTQDDIKEIVAYAARRHIEVIPEIEMPGHTSEVFAAYPELSCNGQQKPVTVHWGDGRPFCVGNDSVFVFLHNVLDEVAALFPSSYIHVGGDEVDKSSWKKCPKCQKRMREEGLKNEDELQSWFIKEIEKYLISINKRLIGWDEILEGGLAPEATVMSWRGEKGGIEAAEQGHDVVMCPGSHCYFDHYQARPEFEPEAIGGYLPLKKVYSYHPVPKELSDDKKHFVLGAQANLWTEFVATENHAEYMVLPRMAALAEVVWSNNDNRDYFEFRKRVEKQMKRYDQAGYHYSKGSFKISVIPEKEEKGYLITLEGEQLLPIHFTLNGTDPTTESPVYTKPFRVTKTTVIKAGYFENGKPVRGFNKKSILFHKAYGKQIKLKKQPSKRYFARGSQSLVDGFYGSENHTDGYWLGFNGDDLEAEIDLGKATKVSKVSGNYLFATRSWIFLPKKVVYTLLDKHHNIIAGKTISNQWGDKNENSEIKKFEASFKPVKARYIKIHAYSIGVCPDWHPGAGNKSWIFTDEITVE